MDKHITKIGGANSHFPHTRWSAIIASGSSNPAERQRGFEVLLESYWKPVYKYIRLKWRKSNEDAKDLTQAFFTKAIEKDFFKGFDPAKARFRTFLRTCLDGFLANEEKAARRLKRGGHQKILSLDFDSADHELQLAEIAAPDKLDDFFDREWVRHLYALSVSELRKTLEGSGKAVHFELFESYDLNGEPSPRVTYEQLASDFNLPVTQVTNYLAYARREFRRILLEKLRELTATDEEFHAEARSLLGADY